MNNPNLSLLRDKAARLPLEPGVYIMKDKSGQIIYVGKAKLLRNRVSSYFRSVEKHLPKVYRMVEHVQDFEFIVTDSEFEALILECSLIKQHTPKYNILLKDDKGYSYIKVWPKRYSRLAAALQKGEEGDYLGPYISSYVVKQTVDEANKVFKLPTCGRKFPEEIGKGRPCLNYHIKQCMGVCRGNITEEEYNAVLADALDFIRDGGAKSIKILTEKMEEAAENLEFERAARYRDRIRAIGRIAEQQKVVSIKQDSLDVIATVQSGDDLWAGILCFRGGRLVDKKDLKLGGVGSQDELLSGLLSGYYYKRGDIPKKIYTDAECADKALLESWLSGEAGHKVELSVPRRGEGVRLVEMARNNAAQTAALALRRGGRELAALDELGRLLGLESPPAYIEAYDISNIGSDTIVGGMVVFCDGKPLKAAYRKFSIRETVGTPDDYASMCEMLRRRFEEYAKAAENGITVGFGRMPDLILLDGGKGHVGAVLPLLRGMGVTVPVFGMVKDDRHRTRAIAADGGELSMTSLRAAFNLVTSIQDEVHRYSISYSRAKHQTSSLELRLEAAPGIGPARARALYLRFRSMKAVSAASVDELATTPGMNRSAAERLYNYLHGDEE